MPILPVLSSAALPRIFPGNRLFMPGQLNHLVGLLSYSDQQTTAIILILSRQFVNEFCDFFEQIVKSPWKVGFSRRRSGKTPFCKKAIPPVCCVGTLLSFVVSAVARFPGKEEHVTTLPAAQMEYRKHCTRHCSSPEGQLGTCQSSRFLSLLAFVTISACYLTDRQHILLCTLRTSQALHCETAETLFPNQSAPYGFQKRIRQGFLSIRPDSCWKSSYRRGRSSPYGKTGLWGHLCAHRCARQNSPAAPAADSPEGWQWYSRQNN